MLHGLGARFLACSSSSIESLGELERLHELTAYLVREQDRHEVVLRPRGQGPSQVVDEVRSPVIAVSRSVLHAGRLSEGRFYVVTRSWSSDGELIERTKDFLTWADRAFRTVKRRLRFVHSLGAYCGQEAAEFLSLPPIARRGR